MKKSESKNNRKRRRILLAFIMILFTGIILTASTYAWFTANRTVKVESVDVTVTTSTGLQISTDATNWKSVVTNTDITGANWLGVTNQLPNGTGGVMAPVSTAGETDSETGFMNMYKGTIVTNKSTGNNILTATKSTETNSTTTGDFVAFDLFFQSNEAHDIYLTSNSSVTATPEKTDSGIQNAARVAFITEGHVAYGSAASAAQALKTPGTPYIWEPNYDVHTASGIDNARNTYGIKTTATDETQLAYNGVKTTIAESAEQALNSKNETYFTAMKTNGSVAAGIPTDAYLNPFHIDEGVTKVRIYMWVEGQDVDCEDKASGGSLSYNLSFSIDSNANA